MNLDQQLRQPLAPIRDDGFSVLLVRRLRTGELRMSMVMWSLLALGFAPVLLALQLVDTGVRLPSDLVQWLNSQLTYPLGVLLLLWVWKPRIFPR